MVRDPSIGTATHSSFMVGSSVPLHYYEIVHPLSELDISTERNILRGVLGLQVTFGRNREARNKVHSGVQSGYQFTWLPGVDSQKKGLVKTQNP